MNDLLVQILMSLVSVSITAVAGFIANFLRKKGHVAAAQLVVAEADKVQKDIANKKSLALDVVQFVEQRYGNQTTVLKFDHANKTLMAEAQKYGLDITPDSASMLIEAVLKEVKTKLGEQWSTPVDIPADPAQPVTK